MSSSGALDFADIVVNGASGLYVASESAAAGGTLNVLAALAGFLQMGAEATALDSLAKKASLAGTLVASEGNPP